MGAVGDPQDAWGDASKAAVVVTHPGHELIVDNTTRRLLARIKKHEGQLGWRVRVDGWAIFYPPAGRTS